MARTALKNKQRNALQNFLRAKAEGRKLPFPTRVYNRCNLCGRVRGYMRAFGMCRICFRELASNGEMPGITKSSW